MAAGRKRKPGKRERNGRPVRTPLPDPRAHVLAWPCRSHLPQKARLSDKAATPLGGLNLLGVITDEQYEAGRRYAGIVMRYRAVIEAPNPAPGGMDHGGRGYIDPEEAMRRKGLYDAAYAAFSVIPSVSDRQRAQKWVKTVAVYDEACPGGKPLEALILGLSTLAIYFGLTSPAKCGPVRNVK